MASAAFTDLFSAGAGFEVAGAVLLAQGLMTTPRRLAGQITFSHNTSSYVNVRYAEDRADGEVGRASLVAGFTLQAVAYALAAGGTDPRTHGSWAYVVSAGCAIFAIAVTYAAWRAIRPRRTRAFLAELARYDRWARRHDDPEGYELMDYGVLLGHKPFPHERGEKGLVIYAKRVFGVERVRSRTDDVMPTDFSH